MQKAWMFVLMAVAVSRIAFVPPSNAQDYNSVESLCASYAGQPVFIAKGQTRAATCEFIRKIVAGLSQVVTVSPFAALARRTRANPTKLWAEVMTEPGLRDSCSREWTIRETAYVCHMVNLSTRVVLNPSGTIARWKIPVPASNSLLQNQFALGAADVGIDSFTYQGTRLLMDALAMRFRQIASEGEFYHVNDDLLNITITNVYGN